MGGVSYAVICECGAQPGDPFTPLQEVTATVSHELVESATDPYTFSNPAFSQTDDNNAIWTIATGGELADMCENNADANLIPAGSTYAVQRSWSNAAAQAGQNPCVPAPSAPYFNSYPILPDNVTLNYGGDWVTRGVIIPVGMTKTIDIVLSSTAPTSGPWTIAAWDMNDFLGNPPNTTLTLDKTTGVSGDVVHLTITVKSYDPAFGGAGFMIESTLDGQDNLTMGAVGQ
jgi:hypothetical protein